jgi:hypothetical protein
MLERIKEDKRQPLEDIVNIKGLNQELERIKPQLLGYIFDILSKVLKTLSTGGITKPKELPRMADFALHGEIVARYLGYDENVFLNAFNENVRLQSDELLETNPLAMTVFQFVQWTPEFKGSATGLLKELNLKAEELGIQRDNFWPKSPGALSRRLNLIRTSLRRIGVEIELLQHQGKDGKSREIRVRKIPSEASESSVTSDISPNQTRIHTNASDDIIDDNDDTNKVSSEGSTKNRAQNGASDDTDNSDDTFHITSSPSPTALTSNSYQQQSSYNNGNDKASLGETASSQQTMTNDSAVAKTISRLGKQEAHPYTGVKNYDILQENSGNVSYMSQTTNIDKVEEQISQPQGDENRPQHKFQDESNNITSKKDSREEVVVNEEREEDKRRILEENPNMPKDDLEFMLSLPVERKITKVTELETIHATAEQQEEMDRLLKNNND